jgi:hypothetical protein
MAAGTFVTSHVAEGHVASREDYDTGMSEVVTPRQVIVRKPEGMSNLAGVDEPPASALLEDHGLRSGAPLY